MLSPQLEQRVRECGCPPYVLCAHFDETLLWMVDDKNDIACRHHLDLQERFVVFSGVGAIPCEHCENAQHLVMNDGNPDWRYFPDLPSAQAEFDRRAEELRNR